MKPFRKKPGRTSEFALLVSGGMFGAGLSSLVGDNSKWVLYLLTYGSLAAILIVFAGYVLSDHSGSDGDAGTE